MGPFLPNKAAIDAHRLQEGLFYAAQSLKGTGASPKQMIAWAREWVEARKQKDDAS